MSIPTVQSTSKSTPTCEKTWDEYITLDLFIAVLQRTFLHPFVAWVVVLSLRAQLTPYGHPAMITAITHATFLTLYTIGKIMSQRMAFGSPRKVDLGEEVVVITGGASGLGLLIAQIYGMRGVSVAVLDVKEAADLEGWQELSGVEYYKCDVGDRKEVEKTAKMIEKDLGTPTVLINCAAAGINGQPFLSLSANAFKKTIQTNLLAPFHTCQTFLPGMLETENGGTIVNVSSVLGQLSAARLSDYSASKAGLSALHRSLEAELQISGHSRKVKTLLVEIGQMSTPLFDTIETPNPFFAPILEPVQVAQAIISVVDSGNGGVIRLPAFAALVSWYAVLPFGIQKIARLLSGIDTAVAIASAVKTLRPQPSSQEQTSESEVEIINAER